MEPLNSLRTFPETSCQKQQEQQRQSNDNENASTDRRIDRLTTNQQVMNVKMKTAKDVLFTWKSASFRYASSLEGSTPSGAGFCFNSSRLYSFLKFKVKLVAWEKQGWRSGDGIRLPPKQALNLIAEKTYLESFASSVSTFSFSFSIFPAFNANWKKKKKKNGQRVQYPKIFLSEALPGKIHLMVSFWLLGMLFSNQETGFTLQQVIT